MTLAHVAIVTPTGFWASDFLTSQLGLQECQDPGPLPEGVGDSAYLNGLGG